MSNVPKAGATGQESHPTDPPVDLTTWRNQARSTLADLLAAAEDATLPLSKRQLGRLEHISIIMESGRALHTLLDNLPGA